MQKNYKCSQSTVRRFLERNGGIIITKEQFLSEIKILPDNLKDIITQLYQSRISMPEIAVKYNVTMSTLRAFFIRHNIVYKTSKWLVDKTLLCHKDQIIKMYEEHKSLILIAEYFNCSSPTIAKFLDRHNIPRKTNNHNHIPLSDKDKIYKMHHEQMMTTKQIGKYYGCTAPTIAEFFDRYGIIRRTKAEASTLVAQNPETIKKQKRSLFTHKPYTLPSGKIIKIQGYEPQFLDYIFNNKLLSEDQIEYNAPRISYIDDNKKRYYFPDFYIPHLNLIIEVKSKYIYQKQGIINNQLKEQAVINNGYNIS